MGIHEETEEKIIKKRTPWTEEIMKKCPECKKWSEALRIDVVCGGHFDDLGMRELSDWRNAHRELSEQMEEKDRAIDEITKEMKDANQEAINSGQVVDVGYFIGKLRALTQKPEGKKVK